MPALEINEFQQVQHNYRQEIALWLSPIDFTTLQSDLMARREEGTGLWFLNSSAFSEWIHKSNQTLFCHGIPGAGKTIIAAATIDHLLKTVQSNTAGIAYIYFNYKAQECQNTIAVLGAILKQLILASPSVPESLVRLYEHHAIQQTRLSLKEIFHIEQAVLRTYSSVYIVIDALDECIDSATRTEVLAKLHDLQSKTNLHLMVTSRPFPDITSMFRLTPKLDVQASRADLEADLERFVAGQIHSLSLCIQHDAELQRMVKIKTVEAADGMSVFRATLWSTTSL